MTALLTRAARVLSSRSQLTVPPLTNGCAPDCVDEYICDSSNRYYKRRCCFDTSCVWYCQPWTHVGRC
jgi:hypothetical protein